MYPHPLANAISCLGQFLISGLWNARSEPLAGCSEIWDLRALGRAQCAGFFWWLSFCFLCHPHAHLLFRANAKRLGNRPSGSRTCCMACVVTVEHGLRRPGLETTIQTRETISKKKERKARFALHISAVSDLTAPLSVSPLPSLPWCVTKPSGRFTGNVSLPGMLGRALMAGPKPSMWP